MRATQAELLDRLKAEARRLGGEIISSRNPDQLTCPFSAHTGIDYDKRQVFYHPDKIPKKTHPATLIHEMGHVFAARRRPEISVEIWFLGWEYAMARRTGMVRAWVKEHALYCIQYRGAFELRDLTGPKLQYFLDVRLRAARRHGLVKGDKPVLARRH